MAIFSIVVPIYFNEPNLDDTVPALLSLEKDLGGDTLELVFVDDGSQDRSLELLREFQKAHPDNIQVVKLTRNFGSMSAILAGMHHARGDCVGMIAADLQDPHQLFIEMHDHWRRGAKAVFAVRADREEAFSQKLFSNTYYALMRRFALPGYPAGGFDFFLIDRQVVEHLKTINEKNTNLMSLVFWLGFHPTMIPYTRKARTKGVSRWTFSKKVKLFIDSFAAFSYVPIRFFSLLGALIAAAAFVYGAYVLTAALFGGIPVKGYAPLMVVLAFVSGVQMLMLGILGEYLWRVLDETRRRPPFVVDQVWAGPANAAQPLSSRQTAPGN